MMRAIAIAATVVMCAACAGQDQQSDGVGAPKATPAGMVDKLNQEINAALAGPKPIAAAQVTDANAVGDPQPVPNNALREDRCSSEQLRTPVQTRIGKARNAFR